MPVTCQKIRSSIASIIALSTIVIASLVCASLPAAGEEVLQIRSTSGAKLRVLITGDAAGARANIILLAGGKGILKITRKGQIGKGKNNFLVRTRQLFADAGFLTAVVDAPKDRWKSPGLLGGFRASREHAADLSRVISKLFERNMKPVILIGTSRGSVSAANGALRDTSGHVIAAILTASLVKPNKKGKVISDLPLEQISVPLLFVHNSGDRCKVTRLKGVRKVVRRLRKTGRAVDLIVVKSVERSGRHCGGKSPHGFLGIEQEVIARIVAWIAPKL